MNSLKDISRLKYQQNQKTCGLVSLDFGYLYSLDFVDFGC